MVRGEKKMPVFSIFYSGCKQTNLSTAAERRCKDTEIFCESWKNVRIFARK